MNRPIFLTALLLISCILQAGGQEPLPFKAFYWGVYLGLDGAIRESARTEAAPEITVWFGDRKYQKELAEKGEDFIISSLPKLRIESRISQPYSLSAKDEDYRIVIDEGSANTRSYPVKDLIKTTTIVSGTMTLPVKLDPGKHTFVISVKSSGARGNPTEARLPAKVTVLGGPLRIVDIPLVFPSPFNPERDHRAAIQYTLSDDADIDIFIYNIAAKIIRKISVPKEQEGGTAQLNKIYWDGKEDAGTIAPSGIYIGNIVSRQEKKVLGKFKLAIYR